MSPTVFKIVKIVVQVASIGVSLATTYLSKKEIDGQIAKKVAEAIADSAKNEA